MNDQAGINLHCFAVYSFLFRRITPFLVAAMDNASTASMIAALVIADKVNISLLSPFMFTMIRVFCSVRIDTNASTKLIVRNNLTKTKVFHIDYSTSYD